jgi:DnaJ-class molecular chaperone|tara:strand:+ start:1251 stop:2123 length:873 start_codon:yes stop_codon:yes gene_type:complete
MKNYYDILGVSEDASNDQIKKAFKNIAKKEHPDRGGNETVFKEANEAYDTLKDTKKRQEYDTLRKYGQAGHGGNFNFRSSDFFGEDIFENFFSGFGFQNSDMDFQGRGNININPGFRSRRRGPTNKSVNVRMAISIKEAMNNLEKTINYKLPSGKEEFATIKIPAGCQNGITFKYRGMGDDTLRNVPRGDLMVQLTVLDSDGYSRKANDLYTDKTISCFDAVRGCELQLKTLTDSIIKVKVPPGTQPNTLIVCKGQGMPIPGGMRGNLYVKIVIIIPQLSQKDLNKIKDL